ncbi:MAG: hydrogenase maturation nickel metallochaperone HypA [Gammaproteobacteria bacterium]|nr:hydrogenase maturation nickel metallochaperone HypA [Gammaproteobacteria bacterium]
MHEMSLCEGIVQILEDQAKEANYSKVKTVWLEVGVLSGIEIRALEFSYDVVCRGTLAEGSRLEIISLPAIAWCMACAESVNINERHDACPTCGSYQLQVSSGDEMRIKELEVE